MSSPVEQIKQRLGIVDVISSYIKLQKAGKGYKAKSPFTNEKTPSFHVSPDRDMYYCFSSGKGGDIFTFVQEMEGLDFKGALAVLAERAGVELTPYRKENQNERDRLFSLMETATRFYEKALAKDNGAQTYLTKRGVSSETVMRFRVGYAPSGWRNLHDALLKLGYSARELEQAGLIKPSEKKKGEYYDRFRGRLMFPISDPAGRVIAFSGRILPDKGNPEYTDKIAKYINSPETPLYSKSSALYGYDKAKHTIRKFNFSIVVEGQTDLLMSHQAGYTNTVAVSGSAMTEAQLTLLNRLSQNVVLAFDADSAGVASAGRTARLALSMGMNVKVALLPSGVDPADLVLKGDDAWKKVVREAKHIVDFYLDHLARTISDPRNLRLEVSRVVLPYIARIPNKIDQAHFVGVTASKLGIDEAPVREELSKVRLDEDSAEGQQEVSEKKANNTQVPLSPLEERLVGIILWQRGRKGKDIDLPSLEQEFTALVGEARSKESEAIGKENLNQLLFEVESLYEDAHELQADVDELLLNLRRQQLVANREEVLLALRGAEEKNDAKKAATLTKRYSKLTEELESLLLPS